MTKSRGVARPRRAWSEFELAVLRAHYAHTVAADLAELFNRPLPSIYAKAKKLELSNSGDFYASPASGRTNGVRGASARFQKGHAPANKGLRRPGWAPGEMARTQFKKGQVAANYMPPGSHRINADGYLDRKLRDDGPPQDRWKPVHRLLWIEANGPVPAGHVIAFKPGMRTAVLEEISLERVECISLADNCRRNSFHNYGPEMSKVVQLRGAITRQINRRLKEQSE